MATVPDETTAEVETHRKPPFLRRVRIRNYKSIRFCDVTLEPLTVLVGRNGSGKSNFVDALAFLRDVIEVGASQAVRRHGGRNRVVSRGDPDDVITFEVEAIIPRQPEGDWQAYYRINLSVEPQRPARVISESLRMAYPGQQAWSEFARDGDRVRFGAAKEVAPPQIAYSSNQSLLGHSASITALNFMTRSCGVQTYNFRPDLIRQPQPSNPEQVLEGTGRNLASVLGSIEAVQPTLLNPIRQYFSIITGGIELAGVVNLGQYESVGFRVPSTDTNTETQFDAASMSDGTLRVLAALTAAFQPGWPLDAPTLVAIEEPETSLHPAAMHALVDALDEATGRTQILLTTHSAELLDNPTIRPENVRVVEMVNGETVITPVDEASVEIVKQQLDTLGGLERQNQLSLNLDDQDRQQKLAAGSDAR